MHYITILAKRRKISSSKLNKVHKHVMKQNIANLNYTSMICNTKYKNLFGLKKKIYDKKQKAHNKLIQSKACDFKIKIM